MPGMVGLITKLARVEAMEKLRHMVEMVHHETFYTTGTWCDESSGVYVGWTAPEGSCSDGMPLQSEEGDITLLFSGEEYTEVETPVRGIERMRDGRRLGDRILRGYMKRIRHFQGR